MLVASGCGQFGVVGLIGCRHRPGDARQFIGQCNDRLIPALTLPDATGPYRQRIVAFVGMQQQRSGAVDEGRAQFPVAVFADTEQTGFPARAVGSRHQPDPGGALSAVSELPGTAGSGDEGGAGQRTDAGYLLELFAERVVATELGQTSLHLVDALAQGTDLLHELGDDFAGRRSQVVSGIFQRLGDSGFQ